MVTNPYFLRARLFPTVLTSIPLLILVNKVIELYLFEPLKSVFEVLPLITGLGLSAALLFLSIQTNRLIAKEVFQKFYFKEEIKMPTTNHLLWKDTFFDKSIKHVIRLKVQSKYSILLMDENEEIQHEDASRKQIATAVSQIRNSLRDNKLLFQHNIEYGFFRNLVGGALLAVLWSLLITLLGYLQHQPNLVMSGIILFVIYLIPILISKILINRFGSYYSKILYEQFLTL